MTEDEMRAILTEEWQARLALKEARARTFLGYTAGGGSAAKAWQQVTLDTMSLQVRWEQANAEKYLLSLTRGVAPDRTDEP
jgi:hypothetical protein